MIKHRFIVSADDFKIFAAIPSETKLLTWQRWWRPADWGAFKKCIDSEIQIFGSLEKDWNIIADAYLAVSRVRMDFLEEIPPGRNEEDIRRVRAAQSAEARIVAGTCNDFLVHLHHLLLEPEGDLTEFTRRVSSLVDSLGFHVKGDHEAEIEHLMQGAEEHGKFYSRQISFRKSAARDMTEKEIEAGIEFGNLMRRSYENLFDLLVTVVTRRKFIRADIIKLSDLISSDLVPDLTCPPGVPFPAYTMEWGDVVVNVVEGHAWVEGDRAPKEDERRVVEIVSQMLTERSLNPKAPTRIPVREIDPKHAHEQRESDKRPGPPKVRTIKFFATPPRYLREAAESIRESHVKAHWVVGHWRNQPWGEKHLQRRQTWIAPHIRGLGEASASTSRVFAPKESPKPVSS